MSRKILLGVVPKPEARFREIFEACELNFVQKFVDAQDALRSAKYDMIVVGVLFDESRMFDSLRFLRTEEKHRTTPIVCVRSQLAISARGSWKGSRSAVKALEVDGDRQSGMKR